MIDVVRMNSDEVCDLVRQVLPQARTEDALAVIAEWMNDHDLTIEDLSAYLNGEEEG